MTALAIDYAWQHPAPKEIKAAGYAGVIRYLSPDISKNLTKVEAQGLHAEGLWILLVWESTSTRATEGANAGSTDCARAEAMALALGYPKTCPIFYACDSDANPANVLPYYKGIADHAAWYRGAYGSARVVDAVAKLGHFYGWQTVAWSRGVLSPNAHLYQRITPTRNLRGGGFDEDAVLKALPVWAASSSPVASAPPRPAPLSPPHVTTADELWQAIKSAARAKGLT